MSFLSKIYKKYQQMKENLLDAEKELNYKKIFIIAAIGYITYLILYLWFFTDQVQRTS